MELWIRSKDKRILQKVDNVYLNANYDNRRICTNDSRDYESDLGEYETKERALEVLDKIQTLLKSKVLLNSGKILESFEDTIYSEPDKVEIQELNIIVYEMPKE